MDALIVYPENKEHLIALKAVTKAMEITFEQKSELYPASVIKGVKDSLNQAENGILISYTGIKAITDTSINLLFFGINRREPIL